MALALTFSAVTISIHALREESDTADDNTPNPESISIHALREESDPRDSGGLSRQTISIHALREESDQETDGCSVYYCEFQSTLSVRRATSNANSIANTNLTFQSTLSVRRATGALGGDMFNLSFQSTLSVRRATCSAYASSRT